MFARSVPMYPYALAASSFPGPWPGHSFPDAHGAPVHMPALAASSSLVTGLATRPLSLKMTDVTAPIECARTYILGASSSSLAFHSLPFPLELRQVFPLHLRFVPLRLTTHPLYHGTCAIAALYPSESR